jgi:hypothetical protein
VVIVEVLLKVSAVVMTFVVGDEIVVAPDFPGMI